MKHTNKYLYGWKLYVNYGQGWEYETFEETVKGYKENRRLYQENCTYPQKWSRGRERNPAYWDDYFDTNAKVSNALYGNDTFYISR